MKKITMNLENLFINKIAVLYDVESELVKALPKMVKASTDPDLKSGFAKHFQETKMHVERLENVFSILNLKPRKLKSEAIRGLAKDSQWVIKNVRPKSALDANLARAAQYVEHYEIAGYRGAISWAEELELPDVVSLLRETLEEEQAADKKLDEGGEKLQKEISN